MKPPYPHRADRPRRWRRSPLAPLAALCLLAYPSLTAAQTNEPPAPTTAESAPLTPTPLTTAPLISAPILLDRSDRMTLPVMVAGHGPYGFVVDSGSERTVISRELAARLDLQSAGRARVVGIAEAVITDLYHLESLQLRDLPLSGMVVPAFAQSDIGGPGLIGIDSLENHRVLIDFVAGRMDIRPSAPTRRPAMDSEIERDAIVVTAQRRAGRMILSNAQINGHRIDLIIDTGAQSSVGNLALRRLVLRQPGQRRGGMGNAELQSVTGGMLQVQLGQINRISVGGLDFTALPIAYADSPAFTVLNLNRRPALLLGMDALRLFERVSIDFTNRRVVFDLPDGAARGVAERLAMEHGPHPG